jgi:Excalibur calcium-binding domain
MKAIVLAIVLAVLAYGLAAAISSARVSISYPNCKTLNARYPHGVGRWGARDHTSGIPVTNFKRSNRLYRQNRNLDRDKDYIACEKR